MITFLYTFHLTFICATVVVMAVTAATATATMTTAAAAVLSAIICSYVLPNDTYSMFAKDVCMFLLLFFLACETKCSHEIVTLAFCGHKRNPIKYGDLILNCDTFVF